MSQMTALEQRITDQYLSYAYPDEPQQDLEQAAMQATVGTLPQDTKDITAAQFGKMAMDVPAGLLKGGVQASIGLSGDMIDLVKGAISVVNRPPGQGWLDAFLQGTGGRTVLPTTEDVRKFIDETLGMPLVPASETDPMRREAAKVPEFIGELGGAGKTMVAGARGAAAVAQDLAPTAGRMAEDLLRRQGLLMEAAPVGPNVVSTRLPTAVKAKEDPLTQNLVIGLEASKTDPVAFTHNVNLVKTYPNIKTQAADVNQVADEFINEVKNNLLYLYDQVPEATRQRSKLWYDGARNIVDRWGREYNQPDQALAGVLAVLSPQKDWFMNVSLGQRVIDIAQNQKAFRWDSNMDQTASQIWADPKYKPVLDLVRNKRFEELDGPAERALWLRTFDQAFNPRSHNIVTPEGDFADIRKTQSGKDYSVAWGSLNEIGKAISVIEDPSKANISAMLGGQHKVRNFYNNIYAPTDPAGHVTIDTHAVAAGLLRPLSGNSREVLHNFGSGVKGEVGPKNSSVTGVQGTYGLYTEAYRRAAAERGVLPREMQSITWEAVRGLFPDTFKTAANARKIDDIWVRYRSGDLSIDEARNEVIKAAGGIRPPEWEGSGLRSAAAAEGGAAGNAGQLSGSGVPGGSPERSGRIKPSARNQSGLTRGNDAPQNGAQ